MAQLLRRDWGVYARVGLGTAGVTMAYSAISSARGGGGVTLAPGVAIGAGAFATASAIAFDLLEDKGWISSPLGQAPAIIAGTGTALFASILMAVRGGGIVQSAVGGAVVGLGAGVGTAGADLANDLYRSRMANSA